VNTLKNGLLPQLYGGVGLIPFVSAPSNWIWFGLALAPAIVSQIVRVPQTDPVAWLACDYAGRLGSLAVLAVIPTARMVAFRREALEIPCFELAIWIVGLLAFELIIGQSMSWVVNVMFPGTWLTTLPQLSGWLYALDLTFGVALVAYHEEVLFRRCARGVFGKNLGEGTKLVIATALLFGAFHWSRGLGTIVAAVMFGIVAMTFYVRAGVLWPLVLVHYVTDVVW
jgi:CAAX protease family protein